MIHEPVSKAELSEMKRHLRAYWMRIGAGAHVGVKTQDLTKSRLGRTLVTVDQDGNEVIDLGRVMNLFLATMAEG